LNKVQTDNSYFNNKIELRKRFIEKGKKINILDFYSGNGTIWKTIKNDGYDIQTTRFDLKDDRNGIYLQGKNSKYLNMIDFDKYDIIDLDAYGAPIEILDQIFKRKIKNKIVFCTYIQVFNGVIPIRMLEFLGIKKEWYKKNKAIFNRNPFEKIKKYLYFHGIKTIIYIEINQRKHYFAFKI
jgi:hypothetical protein